MAESRYLDIAGSGPLRITTPEDVRGAIERREAAALRERFSLQDLIQSFSFNGVRYPFISSNGGIGPQEPPPASFEGYVSGLYKSNGIVFACMAARFMLFSEARFLFRRRENGRPGELFFTPEVEVLERPWPNGSMGDLLLRMSLDADLAGNFYARRMRDRIYRMRPDWVTIVLGSNMLPDEEAGLALDAEVIGYIYEPGGPNSSNEPVVLLPEEVCHYAPIPDPVARFRGMSWLTPVLREIMGDSAATEHKLSFFENGATPNFVVTSDPSVDATRFQEFVRLFKQQHGQLEDAYNTIFLGGGADVKVIGSNLQQIDFKQTQGGGETRICAAARVPPIIVGISEGLDAATYSNYGQARRAYADLTMRPLWRKAASSLAAIVDEPPGAELWYDDRDIPFLQEDVEDASRILETETRSIRQLVDAGFSADDVVDAVTAGDLRRLKGKHTGLFSVQLHEPGSEDAPTNGKVPDDVEVPAP